MTSEIKQRIEQIRRGEMPEGYNRVRDSIIPSDWKQYCLGELGKNKNGLNFHREDKGIKIRILGVGDFGNLSVLRDLNALSEISMRFMPDDELLLKNGDIVSIDIGACYKGYHGDSAWSYKVGNVSLQIENLLKDTEQSLYEGLKQIKPGNRIGDISASIEKYAHEHQLGVVKELVGHGVGTSVHEDPDVPNFGIAGTGPALKEGMVLAVEPMLTLGSPEIVILDDDWTIETKDYSPSAHFEHTVVVTDDGCKILTGV